MSHRNVTDEESRGHYGTPRWPVHLLLTAKACTSCGEAVPQLPADRHYDLLDKPGCKTVPQIRRVVRASPLWRPFPDASHLWMWATDNYLEAALWLMRELGFDYKRTFPWIKTGGADSLEALDGEDLRAGIGQYARGEHELLLFGVAGDGMSPLVYQDDRGVGSVIVAPHERGPNGKIIHSRKPLAAYQRIEARSKGPYAEIFARRGLPGWDSWGNEIDGAELLDAPPGEQTNLFGVAR